MSNEQYGYYNYLYYAHTITGNDWLYGQPGTLGSISLSYTSQWMRFFRDRDTDIMQWYIKTGPVVDQHDWGGP
jgi:hypothetical protein